MRELQDVLGYKNITWFEVKNEDEIWLKGTVLKQPKAYGPYRVENAHRKLLRNNKGNIFMHYAEDLITPI